MHAHSNTELQNPIPVITSRNSINSTIRNRLLLQVIHFRNASKAVALQSSQRLPELLFYTKRSYKILQLQFQLQFQLQCYTCTLHYNPENSPSRIQFYMQKTKSSSSTTTTFQRAKRSSFQERNSTHRRQGDLLEIHPCVLQDIPGNSSPPETFQTFQSFMTFQPSQAILQCSSISRESTPFQHSPIRMHILHILQFLQFDWFPQKLHRVPVGQTTNITNIHSSKKGRCCDIGQIDRFSRIELFPLSSCQVIILIARMAFNCSTSCLMS